MHRQYNEDLFESSKMTFGEHLDELRSTLIKSILAQEGARLPKSRRTANQKALAKSGLTLARDLHDRIKSFVA